MRSFEIVSDRYEGVVVVKYSDAGVFSFVDFSAAQLSDAQLRYLKNNIPMKVEQMQALAGINHLEVVEIDERVSFDAFWNKYNDKARSSKVKTKRAWDRMSKSEQVKAYRFIQKYFASIPNGISKKYATTYLSDQLWNN